MNFKILYVALLALLLLPVSVQAQPSSQRVIITPENVQAIKEVATLGRGWVQGLVWSPDKRLIAVVSSTGVWLYDMTSPDKEPRQFPIEYFRPYGMPYFSPDGSRLVTVEYCHMIVWNVTDARRIAEFANPCNDEPVARYIDGIHFDRIGRTLVVSYIDGTGYIVDDLDSHARVYSLAVLGRSSYFSPDASKAAICSSSFDPDQPCDVWDLATGRLLITLHNYEEPVWSPDGEALAEPNAGNSIKVWFAADNHQVEIKSDKNYYVTWSPDHIYLAGGADNKTYIWNAQTGQRVARLDHALYQLAFSSDSTTLIGLDSSTKPSNGYSTAVWKFGGSSVPVVLNSSENEGWGAYIAVGPDGQSVAMASYSNLVRVWSLNRPDGYPVFLQHSGVPESLAFSADSQTLAVGMGSISTIDQGSWDNAIWLWNTADNTTRRILNGHTERVTTLDFSADGKFLVSGTAQYDGSRIWYIENGSSEISLDGEAPGIGAVFRPDERMVAVINRFGGDGPTAPVFWYSTLQSNSWHRPPTGLSSRPIAFSNDGTLLAITGKIYDASTEKLKFSLTSSPTWWYTAYVAFSPDDQYLALGENTGAVAELWNAHTGAKVAAWKVHNEFFGEGGSNWTRVAFSPDGKLLAAGGAGNLLLIDVARGQVITTLHTPGNAEIHSIAWSPDGKTLAVGSFEGTVRLWGVQDAHF